jgi:CSLREA domain-containing protein
MRTMLRSLGPVMVGVLLSIAGAATADAATFAVTTNADAVDVNPGDGVCADGAGRCTLRAAIMETNALPGADTITLPASLYALTIAGAGEDAAATGDLDISDDLTIDGAGAAFTVVDGGGLDRVFEIRPGATVQITGLTVRNGNPGSTANAGGILNLAGALVLNGSIVTGNTAAQGGGLFNESGTMLLTACTVSGNTAGAGGGIYNHGTLTVTRSTLNGNRAVAGSGGGLWHNGGLLNLTNSTVSGNTASVVGGGLFSTGTFASIVHGTLDDNAAPSGGGISSSLGVSLQNTLVANSGGGDCAGPVVSLGHNLGSDGTCALGGPGDLNGTNPQLAPLAATGGPTETHALLPTSPAINAVPLAACIVETDQRGVFRPQGPACDIGAFETVPTSCAPPPAGLVAWWPLDEPAGAASLQDIVGGNSLIPLSSPLGSAQGPQPITGIVGGAAQFPKFGNGLSGARVNPLGALATVGAADFTIGAWIFVPPAPADRRHYIVNKLDAPQNEGYALYVVSPGGTGNERLTFAWGDGTNAGTVQSITILPTDQWHHVAVTFRRTPGTPQVDILLFVDGAQVGHQTASPPSLGSLVNALLLEVGWEPSTLDAPIALDELEIFNVALPVADIQAIVNAASAGTCRCTSGGQFVDLTVTGTGAVSGVGSGTGATVSGPLAINYTVQACSGHEMFVILRAPALGLPSYRYYDGGLGTFVPLPDPPSEIRPFVSGGPFTTTGSHTLFSGSLPPGAYDLFLICDQVQNGRLDVASPPLCLNGAFDHLPLTVQ